MSSILSRIFNTPTFPSNSPNTSPFLHLPAELRTQIYEYIYPPSQTLYPFARKQHESCKKHNLLPLNLHTQPTPTYLRPPIAPIKEQNFLALACINHQVRDEVLPILIANTTFVFYHTGNNDEDEDEQQGSREVGWYENFFKLPEPRRSPFEVWLPTLGKYVKDLRDLRIMVRRRCDAPYGHPCVTGFTGVRIDFGSGEVVIDQDEKADGGGQYCRYVKLDLERLRKVLELAKRPGRGVGVTKESARAIWNVFTKRRCDADDGFKPLTPPVVWNRLNIE